MKRIALLAATLAFAGAVNAKLPPPSDEAKAKAAEAAAKTAHSGKVDNYKLCLSMERVAAKYRTDVKAAGKEARPATDTPKCEDPGAFVYPPPAAAAGATAPAAPATTPPAAAKTAAAPAAAPAKK